MPLGTDLTAPHCLPGWNEHRQRLMLASLELSHWLMIAGILLVVAGFVGALVSGKKPEEVEPPPDEPTETPRQPMPPLPGLLNSAKEQRLVTGRKPPPRRRERLQSLELRARPDVNVASGRCPQSPLAGRKPGLQVGGPSLKTWGRFGLLDRGRRPCTSTALLPRRRS